jgi:pimeloyl-ACP methyl ester carboxylesterase
MNLSRSFRKISRQCSVAALQLGFAAARIAPPVAVLGANRLFYRPGRRHTRGGLDLPGVEEIGILVRGRKAAAYIAGAGPPVLLVHGWQTSAEHLVTLARPLLAGGHRVVAFDMPGHGKSEGEETDITEVTEIGLQLSARFGPFAAAIGHSYGGLCLANLLRLGVAADRVILLASPATYQLLVERACALMRLSGPVRERFVAGIRRRYAPHVFERDFDAVKNLARRPVPTLVVHDQDDGQVPIADAELLGRAHPRVKLRITSRLGHSRIVKTPAVIEACLAFLRDAPPAPDDRFKQGDNR